MASFAEVRAKYPQYADMSDHQLAEGLHKKFYSDLPFEDFAQKVGYQAQPQASVATPPIGGMGNFNPLASRFQAKAQQGMDALGMTGKSQSPMANALGPLETLAQAGTGLLGMAGGGFAGLGQGLKNLVSPGMPAADRVAQVQNAVTYQPRTMLGAGMSKVVGLPGEALSAGTTYIGENVAEKTGSPLLGAGIKALGDVAPPGLAGVKATGATRLSTLKGKYTGKAEAPVPTTEQLKTAASDAYTASEQAGVVIRPESTLKVIDMMDRVAKSENLGKLPPKLKEASDILTERLDKGTPLSLKDADKVRQLINDAKKSTDAADQRLASVVQEQYDNYLESLKPEDTLSGNSAEGLRHLTEARELFKRRKNSEMLDQMEHDAGLTGSTNYTQAGVELAMRRQFLSLAKDERRMKMLTPEQRKAVEKVASPGKKANTLRNIGKFDPTRGGVPAFMATILGGGGGAALGGIAGGFAGPALIGAGAHLANRGAANITMRNVADARRALVGPNGGLLAKENPMPLTAEPRGLLGEAPTPAAATVRTPQQIRSQIRALDAELAAVPKKASRDTPRMREIFAEMESLQRELASLEAGRGLL